MKQLFLSFLAIYGISFLSVETGWTKDEISNDFLKQEALQSEMADKNASVAFQPSHNGRLTLENNSKNNVTTYDLDAPPTFEELHGESKDQNTYANDPQQEVYNKIYQEQQAAHLRRNYHEAINQQFHENLKRNGRNSDRNLAHELEALERSNTNTQK